ncbi:MAG: hypothetical protein KAI28_06410, partial [Sphingomonadales bacterium]|nr:hypothetical protein [Sphingomonadales bacterium]
KNGEFVRGLIEDGVVDTAHDVSSGGLLASLADMAISGKRGVQVQLQGGMPAHAELFGEDQARYVLAVDALKADDVKAAAQKAGVTMTVIGKVQGEALDIEGALSIPLADITNAFEGWFPNFMSKAD